MVKMRDEKGRFIRTQPLSKSEYGKQYMETWRKNNRENIKFYQKEWTNKNKSHLIEYNKKYYNENLDSERKYYKDNIIHIKERVKKYMNTDKGRQSRHRIKSNRRKLKYEELMSNPFPEEIKVHWHHINNWFVIPIPKSLHQKYHGYRQSKHRELVNKKIEELYTININNLLGGYI